MTNAPCVQVPVCPLCSAPVPTPRGTLPDIAVGAHIDRVRQGQNIINSKGYYKQVKDNVN